MRSERRHSAPTSSERRAPDAEAIQDGKPMKNKLINLVLVGIAFAILVAYLFFAGEGKDLLNAVSNIRWTWLALAMALVVVYWVLEAGCVQIFANKMFPGFPFLQTNIVTVIGQYFNCITPLSSGGQPFQAYYYRRFGIPLSKSMPMLLSRFISYQFATTVYCAIVLLLRFSYFSESHRGLMALVLLGFIGGLGLMAMLLLLAFWKSGTLKIVCTAIGLLGKIGLMKHADERIAEVTVQIEQAYREVRNLINEPKLLTTASLLTFVQLTEYFLISYVIYRGFGFDSVDLFTIISCQAFVYMISSFVPTPGAMGAAEGSYALFFSSIYPNASFVALSTFIWRFLTFYFPIVSGMLLTFVLEHFKGLQRFVGLAASSGEGEARGIQKPGFANLKNSGK